MFRQLAILLLIPGLIACPLRCLSCQTVHASETAVVMESDAKSFECHCCASSAKAVSAKVAAPESESQGSSENVPNKDCACPDCICTGALPVSGQSVVFTLDAGKGEPARSAMDPRAGSHQWRLPAQLEVSQQGRDAQIAYQRWLL